MADSRFTPGTVTVTGTVITISGWTARGATDAELMDYAQQWAIARLSKPPVSNSAAAIREVDRLVDKYMEPGARFPLGPIGDYRKSEAEKCPDHISRCATCRDAFNRDVVRAITASLPEVCPGCGNPRSAFPRSDKDDDRWRREIESCARRRATPEAPEERTSSNVEPVPEIDVEAATRTMDALRKPPDEGEWVCDRCGRTVAGDEKLPPGWRRLVRRAIDPAVGGVPYDLCFVCAFSFQTWLTEEPTRG